MSIDTAIESIRRAMAEEQERGRINDLHRLALSRHRREEITQQWQAIQRELQTLNQAIRDLPALPVQECIDWANTLLSMKSCLVMELDTTGLQEEAELCRLTVATPYGEVVEDLLINPGAPIAASVTAANGVTNEQLERARPLPQMWGRMMAALQGHYVVSFAQEWDRKQLEKAAHHYGVPSIFFLGECLQRRLTQYYHKQYGLSLADITERMTGERLPQPATAIDRVKAQAATIRAMANGVTDLRPPPSTGGAGASSQDSEADCLDLDEHPF